MSLDEDRFGTVVRNGEGFGLRFTRHIAASPERVWAAITIPERIAAWFAEVEVQIELRLGGAYRLRFGSEGPFTDGEITGFEPLRLLEHTWPNPPHPMGRVRYELEPDGAGCILRLTNTGVVAAYISSLAGWHISWMRSSLRSAASVSPGRWRLRRTSWPSMRCGHRG